LPKNDPTPQIIDTVDEINQIITQHNQRTTDFEENRKGAFAKLEKHYASLFVNDQQYNEQCLQIEQLKIKIKGQNAIFTNLNSEIHELELQLSETTRGAEQINEFLSAYFGRNDLRISVSNDNRFQIIRGDTIAKNLSEGEKTAISFAHFITRIHDGKYPLETIIVVIDDPVSSLDANHLFNTYALIRTQLADCQQLFILTHSFEFYSLIREWASEIESIKNPQSNWKEWHIYLVKRTEEKKSVLEEIPKELLIFKSEYHYLFSILYHFCDSEKKDFEYLLNLPNLARRFMEAFSGIMIPRSVGLSKKMPSLFPDEIMRERVWKFINNYSHNNSIHRSLIIPDMSECRTIIADCLDSVKNWDEEYFKCLQEEVI